MILKRTRADKNGVFGILLRDDGSWQAYTLEHAYLENGGCVAKIPFGIFTCVRGIHILQRMSHPFETFEIQVAGHTNLLFHPGNVSSDSSGCVLLGESQSETCIGYSQKSFASFMEEMSGIKRFQLAVEDAAS